MWNVDDGALAFHLTGGANGAVNRCEFLATAPTVSPFGNAVSQVPCLLATCHVEISRDAVVVCVWDVSGHRTDRRIVDGQLTSPWRSLPLRAGGKVLAVASARAPDDDAGVDDVVLAVGGSAGDLTVFDVGAASPLFSLRDVHAAAPQPGQAADHVVAAVEALAFAPGGTRLASGGSVWWD